MEPVNFLLDGKHTARALVMTEFPESALALHLPLPPKLRWLRNLLAG